MISLAELFRELKEEKKFEDIIGEEPSIVRLSDSRNSLALELHSQVRILSRGELFFPKYFIEVRRVDSPLFQALFISYGAHEVAFPVNVCPPASKPLVDVEEGVATSVTVVEISDKELSEDDIKGRSKNI